MRRLHVLAGMFAGALLGGLFVAGSEAIGWTGSGVLDGAPALVGAVALTFISSFAVLSRRSSPKTERAMEVAAHLGGGLLFAGSITAVLLTEAAVPSRVSLCMELVVVGGGVLFGVALAMHVHGWRQASAA